MDENWFQYKNLFEKYINILKSNPYIDELKEDYERLKLDRFCKYFNETYRGWLVEFITDDIISPGLINIINEHFDTNILLNSFTKKIVTDFKSKLELQKFFLNKNINILDISNNIKAILPKLKFNPSKLKFVTTTAIAWIVNPKDNINIDFKEIYNTFIIEEDVLLIKSDNIYKEKFIGSIVGCKTGGEKIKGHFKKTNMGDFYNCTTVNVLLSSIKSANVKIFNNGKLQMTGISKPSDGERAVQYICNMINKLTKNNVRIITNKENYMVSKFSYKTVMINTCYELGTCINRECLYNIVSKKYNLNTIYDADGYPGVRVEYYYNTKNTKTYEEGRCTCKTKCKGRGTGMGHGECRKISIAIFQSGSAIIAGGCNSVEPIYITYNFINKIIGDILPDVKKNDTESNKLRRERATQVYLNKKSIVNADIYKQIFKV